DLVPRFNFKLTDVQAALGRSQLGRLDTFIARRRAIAARYRARLASLAGCRPPGDAGERHVFHRFVVTLERPVGPLLERLARAGGWLCERQNVAGPRYERQPPGEASL